MIKTYDLGKQRPEYWFKKKKKKKKRRRKRI